MESEKKLQMLQTAYAAALVDAAGHFAREGILEKVTQRKRSTRGAAQVNAGFGVRTPEEVFTNLAEIFGCAAWVIEPAEGGFVARTAGCRMHAIAARMGGSCPCELYCLDPMRSMLEALEPTAQFLVEGTLDEGPCCRVRVKYM